MSDDKLDFLDETSEAVTEPEAPEVEEVEEPTAEEPKEAEAPEVEEAADTGEDEAAPPVAEVEEKPQAIPVTALLDEREKRQLAERKAEEAAKRYAELQRQIQQQQAQQKAPDWDMDPAAAAQYQAQTIEQKFQAQRLEQSKFFAEREFGAETVNEAIAYFDQNPQLSHQFINQPSPFHAAVEFYQKQKFLSEVGENPDAYKEQLRAQIREELMAEMTTSQPAKPKAPPPSMAKAPSTGRDAITPGNAFDSMFPT